MCIIAISELCVADSCPIRQSLREGAASEANASVLGIFVVSLLFKPLIFDSRCNYSKSWADFKHVPVM
ncbi:MAG: hypothetical protein QG604_724 [Candidatus Dependentiae bacterium]|nr:hypothetical protein [Candidatus Dependentiae bacterium]